MNIVTLSCPVCETIVAGNVLEEHRVMKCPRYDCYEILRFNDLSEEERTELVENREKYEI